VVASWGDEPARNKEVGVAGSSLQDMYVRLREYLEMLFQRVEGMKRPSPAMLDRIERLAALQQHARRR
jgi:hypothetical protein